MTNESKHSHVASKIAIASILSGILTRPFIQPLDVVKIRSQLGSNRVYSYTNKKSTISTIIRIYRGEGIFALWRGLLPSQFLTAGYGFIQFEIFENVSGLLINRSNMSHHFIHSLSGSTASMCATVLTYPMDITRTRLVAQRSKLYSFSRIPSGLVSTIYSLIKCEGVISLWKGLCPTMVLIGLSGFCQFGSYSVLHNVTSERKISTDAVNSCVSGFLAGAISKFLTYPFDVVKKRLQIQGCVIAVDHYNEIKPYNGMIHCFKTMIQKEGFSSLFKGLGINVHALDSRYILAMDSRNELIVLSLKNVTKLNLQWTINVLKSTGLLIRQGDSIADQKDIEKSKIKLYIGADEETILQLATVHHLRKICKDGTLRVFDLKFRDQFVKKTGSYVDPAEELFLVWQSIHSVQPLDDGIDVPGTDIVIKKHHTLLRLLNKCNMLDKCFALHDINYLRKLKDKFKQSKFGLVHFRDLQDDIKSYFGVEVAFYFAFTSFYVTWLIPIAAWGLLLYVLPTHPLLIMMMVCLPNVCWWSIFIKIWTRKSNELAFRWGCLDYRSLEKPRSQFISDKLVTNPATGQLEKSFSPFKRAFRQYAVSLPIIGLFCLVTLFTTLLENSISTSLRSRGHDGLWFMSTSTSLMKFFYQSASVTWNKEFKRLAESLNNYENYRLNSDYENNLTFKMFLFFGVRFIFGLVYETFYKSSIGAIEKTLISFFLSRIFEKQFKSTILPYIKKRFHKHKTSIIKLIDTLDKMDTIEKQEKELINYKVC
ncbi:hypothetical protein GJ496_003099 [Pomphorhynchus laevis]|nr:hypothetical protein GJ496_003099 [Pomphorhynchus laevis]